MSANRKYVIKKRDVEVSGDAQSNASNAETGPRIPRAQVAAAFRESAEAARAPSTSRVSRANTIVAEQPFEVPFLRIEREELSAEPTPPESSGATEPTIEEIEAMWTARVERAREEARSEGFQEGRAEATAECEAQLDEATRRFSEDLNAVQQSWEAFLRRAEPQIVQLAFRIARAILDCPLPDDVRRISESAIVEAVERMADGVSVEVVLHPVDYLRIQESGIEEHLSAIHTKLRWRTDPTLKQNEWVVQSQRAATRRLEAELIDQLKRDLSVRDVHRTDEEE